MNAEKQRLTVGPISKLRDREQTCYDSEQERIQCKGVFVVG